MVGAVDSKKERVVVQIKFNTTGNLSVAFCIQKSS